MASLNGYRSPCSPKRFRVLAGSKPTAAFVVCEGLARPSRRAYWRVIAEADTYKAAAAEPHDRALGLAIIPRDCAEVDFIRPDGSVL